MTLPKSLARRIDRLQGESYAYAVDYVAWWLEGGRLPEVDRYVTEDGRALGHARAAKIAAFIRQAVR